MATEKVICDTDVLIAFFDEKKTGHKHAIESIETIGLDNILISAVTKMELIKGATRKEHSQQINKQLKRLDIILLSPQITVRTIELLKTYHLSHGLAIPDGSIAATALETRLELFTYNLRDFRFIKDLKLHQ